MGRVYVLNGSAAKTDRAEELEPITCRSELKELQQLLENRLDLLPVEEMGIGAGTKWVLIKREMPVPSPETGENHWYLDFLLADSEGVPTLVECKLCSSTQARREIVGQMFEYAANGKAYWTENELRGYAEKSAGSREALERQIAEDCHLSVDDFFRQVAANLTTGTMRLVFFLESSSKELRSVVEFLSDQFAKLQVFLVEARQFAHGEQRVIVPWVFGYTEAARVNRRAEQKATQVLQDGSVGERAFWEYVDTSVMDDSVRHAVQHLVQFARELPHADLRWKRGVVFLFPELTGHDYLFALRRDGNLELNIMRPEGERDKKLTALQVQRRHLFRTEINRLFSLELGKTDLRIYPQIYSSVWCPRVDELERSFATVLSAH